MKDIFSTALARLTTVYVLVLVVVCLLFSGFIYGLASNEIDRTSRRQVVGFRNLLGRFIVDEVESENLRNQEADEARSRLKADLILGNLTVISAGTVLSYFFAKRTLKPIEEAAQAQERFTSDASHELRTPLAAMRTEIEVALRGSSLTIKDARELLESNLEEVEVLQQMTNNLLSLARNKELGEEKLVDVSKLLKTIGKSYAPKVNNAGMKLEEKYGSGIKLVTNIDALKQVVGILIENSIKYAGKGAIIFVTLEKNDTFARVMVADSGVGIPASQLESIFARFYKVDSSRTSSKTQGHGLGLSIAKQLVDALHGTIRAESRKGGGVEFLIELPLDGVE